MDMKKGLFRRGCAKNPTFRVGSAKGALQMGWEQNMHRNCT